MNSQKFSLSFSKRIEKKALQPSALRGEGPAEGQKAAQAQALLAVDKDSLKVNEHVEEKDQLVIPLLEAKRSAVLSRLAKLHQEDGEAEEENKEKPSQEVQEDDKPLTLEEKAERALLEETKKKLGEWSARDGKKDITIPATVTDDPLAAPLVDIGKESSLEDYDEIAVESYGAAILRGMGWKKSEGIGGRKKMVVDIINPSARNLGSSEGKESGTKKEVKEEGEEEEEDMPIVKGSFVYLHSGRHRGTYGVVEVVDEDHVLIKAAVGQAILREVEANLRIASQKEYKESARVINKEMYDKFKEAEIKKNEAKKKAREEEEEGRDKGKERNSSRDKDSDKQNERLREGVKEKQRDKEREREGGSERHREREADKHREKQREQDRERQRDRDENRHRRQDGEAERQRYKESKHDTENARQERKDRSKDEHRKDQYARHYHDTESPGVKRRKEGSPGAQKKAKIREQKVMAPPWVRENLRVRLINKSYKGGKYHKEKVVVVSVVTAECCECKAEGGRVLGNIDPAWLETVIPKQPPMVVMVVRGPHNGQKGRILQLHKEQEKASIQLLEDETTILKLHYDDICEYILR